jgi:hypothetical protein
MGTVVHADLIHIPVNISDVAKTLDQGRRWPIPTPWFCSERNSGDLREPETTDLLDRRLSRVRRSDSSPGLAMRRRRCKSALSVFDSKALLCAPIGPPPPFRGLIVARIDTISARLTGRAVGRSRHSCVTAVEVIPHRERLPRGTAS